MARILVVDDRPDVAKAIARMLSNHDTATETDPRQAVARVEHGERFDIVLCDLNMPDMNGREVSDRLVHAHDPPPPIVLMMSGGENVDSLFATGRAVLIKPFDGKELRELVSAMLHDTDCTAHGHA
ncbi:MAG TPA: response regulator [Kofleriaceae bacterium]|jgi:CheY-like chemotaxis protein|nr:response regulator [Kofleriaceae bacterium]